MRTRELVEGSQTGTDVFVKGVQVGLVAYGATHLVIAAMALPLAWGDRSEAPANQQGALAQMAEQPLGDALLWVVVAGMACLVLCGSWSRR